MHLRQPEVEYLHLSVGRDFDVRGFQIAMDDATVVRRLDGLGNLRGDLECLLAGDGATRETIGKRLPFDQFQHEKRRCPGFDQVVDRGDPRVVQRGEHLGLAPQSFDPVRIMGKGLAAGP